MNSERGRFDLIVVGLGAVGSAALFHAASAGLSVLGIDRFDPPHAMGSSHAESRITRLAVGEGEQYLPFAARSHEIWRELEDRTGVALLHQPGGYIITPSGPTVDPRWGGFVERSAAVADEAGVAFEIRTQEQVAEHVPGIILQGHESIGFEPTGGIVMSERAIEVQLRLAREVGATTIVNTPVLSVEPATGGARVHVKDESYFGASVVVSPGAWFADLAPKADADAVTVTRQVVYWFEVDEPEIYSAERFPFVLWPGETIEEYSALFPMGPGGRGLLKMVGEQFHEHTTADSVDRTVHRSEIDDFYERLVAPRVRNVRNRVLDAEVCLYTNTADDHFLIDTHPLSDAIIFASPCSGHGFKHSTAIGEAIAAQLTNAPGLDLSAFTRHS